MRSTLAKLNLLHVFNDGFLVSFGLLLPFISQDLGFNLTEVGFLGSTINSLSVVLALPAGYLAAKYGGLKVIVLAVIFYALGFGITSISSSLFLLSIAFLIAGVGFGLFHPIAFALVARNSTSQTRGRDMGNFTAIGDIGRIVIAGLVTTLAVIISWRAVSLLYGVISGVIFIAFFLSIRKSENTHLEQKQPAVQSIKLIELLRDKEFLLASISTALDSFVSSPLFIFLPFLLVAKQLDPAILGAFTGVFFIGNILGKLFLGRFVDRFGNFRTFVIAEILMAAFIVVLVSGQSLVLMLPVLVILGALTKGTVPVMNTILAEVVAGHGNYEKAYSLNSFTTSLATALSPVLLGLISDRLGINAAFIFMAAFAIIATLPVIYLRLSRQVK